MNHMGETHPDGHPVERWQAFEDVTSKFRSAPRKLAIVGTHTHSREDAPWNDPSYIIWVFNEAANHTWCKRWDAVLQMHKPAIYRSPHNRSDPNHWLWLQQDHGEKKRIYMQEIDKDVPNSVKYPLQSIMTQYLSSFRVGADQVKARYFTSSVAYALALAGWYDFEQVDVYGVEMESDTEYQFQRACVAFWVGVLVGVGVKVNFHGGEKIFNDMAYGYDGYIEQDYKQYEERLKVLKLSLVKLIEAKSRAETDLAVADKDQLAAKIQELAAKTLQAADCEGRITELERYAHKVKAMKADTGLAILDRNEFETTAGTQREAVEKRSGELHYTAGMVNYVLTGYMRSDDPRLLAQVKDLARNHFNAAHQLGKVRGAYGENIRLATEIGEALRAAGGDKVRQLIGKSEAD